MIPASKNTGLAIPADRKGVYAVGTSFYRNGKEVRGVGVNHWGSFIDEITPLGPPSDYLVDLPDIKNNWGLPFVRVGLCMWSKETWYTNYFQNKAAYFGMMDAYVAKCEALGLGIIAALTWGMRGFTDACYAIYGTFEPPKALAYKHTNAWKLFEQYITEVVTRYKDSPAIWGWELGNEVVNTIGVEYWRDWPLDGSVNSFLNWGTRPQGGNYAITDKMDYSQWWQFTTNFIELVNSLDPHRRIISSGSPVGNSFAVNAQTQNTLAADTLAQWNGVPATEGIPWMCYRDKPFPIMNMHIYPQSLTDHRFFGDSEKTLPQLIQLSREWSDQVGKPFFLGEFGATYHGPGDTVSTDQASEEATFYAGLAAAQSYAKLSAVWNYAGNLSGPAEWMYFKMTDPARLYQLEAMAAANAAMQV